MQQTFRGKPLILGAYSLVLIAVVPLVWLVIKTDPDWLLVSSIIAGGVAAILAWPRKIVIDDEAITQRSRVGISSCLPLKDIDSIAGSVREGSVMVSGPTAEIRHNWLHADREEFIRVLEQLTGKKIFWGDWPG